MKAAFFDLDGTLLNGYTWEALRNHHSRKKFKRRLLYVFLSTHYPLYPMVKMGLLSRKFFYRAWGENMAWLVKGVPIDSGTKIWDWVVENEYMKNIRPEMDEALQFHKSLGHHLVFVSGTFQPLLDRLKMQLSAHAALGTLLEKKDGFYTGRIINPLNVGHIKVQKIKAYLNELNSKIDLKNSFMYSDSIVDLPVLELVGNPVAVYPEKELMAHALKSNWKIIGLSDYVTAKAG